MVLLSCLVKVTLQLEFGKHAISTGESIMAAFNKLPGWKINNISWAIWIWLFIQLFKLLQVGGIIGGVAITLNIIVPSLSVVWWTILTTIVVSLLVFRGYYQFVERFSLVMIAFFTLLTFLSVYFLQDTAYAFSWQQIVSGLHFELPPAMAGIAIAAFGITGIGGNEIMYYNYYNYWCLEKGYATYTGPAKDDPEWIERAKGWIRVMYWDAALSMVVYTLVTAAFYVLGASVLHARNKVPQGYQMIETLTVMYTHTLGAGAKNIFLAWVFPVLWALLFLFLKLPVTMVIIGGFFTSVLLLIVVFAAIHFRYVRLHRQLRPPLIYDIALWLSIAAILLAGIYGIAKYL